MATFEFRNAQEIGRICGQYGVKYLFFGKSGAILLGYSDTTQDVDLYVEKQTANCAKLVGALVELGFRLSERNNRRFGEVRISFSSETAAHCLKHRIRVIIVIEPVLPPRRPGEAHSLGAIRPGVLRRRLREACRIR
jgi:hypothetical protein